MFSWFFKKRDHVGTQAAVAPVPAAPPRPAARQQGRGQAPAGPAGEPAVDWAARLRSAQGDDALLLSVAQSAPVLEIKMAAVEGLAAEAALRQAEREFRSHDRKVHRVAKQRLEAAVARRAARARADELLVRTRALIGEALAPLNHVVALDRDWEQLRAELLLPEQRERFAELRAELDAAIRRHGEEQQRQRSWLAEAHRALPEWRGAIAAAAEHGAAGDAARLGPAIEALRAARPDAAATAELDGALALALRSIAAVEARLAWFAAPPTDATGAAPAAASGPSPAGDGAAAIAEPPPVPAGEPVSAQAGGPAATPAVESEPAGATASRDGPVAEPVALAPFEPVALAGCGPVVGPPAGGAADPASGPALGSAPAADPAPAAGPVAAPEVEPHVAAPEAEPHVAAPEAEPHVAAPVGPVAEQVEEPAAAAVPVPVPVPAAAAAAIAEPAAYPSPDSGAEPAPAPVPAADTGALPATGPSIPGTADASAETGVEAAPPSAAAGAAAPGVASESAPAGGVDTRPKRAWTDLPALTDADLARILNQRHERWLRERRPARPAPPIAAAVLADKPARAGRPSAADARHRMQLAALAAQAETALAEGRLGEMQQHLQAIDAGAGTPGGADLPDDLRTRLQALRAEAARLKGWQAWGGGRARDDLTAEAEELARLTLAAGDPEAAEAAKLNLKAHAQSIQELRARWKELDRLGAAGGPALWRRFDAALQTAFAPIAAQQVALKEARQGNLEARRALLDALDAVRLPDPAETAAAGATDGKELARALGEFQLAWRKLGPLEHTVPADARAPIQERLRAAVERVEQPLHELRRVAIVRREHLIAQAEALLGEATRNPFLPEPYRQVRELQAEWQHQARQLSLLRADETALWARFKTATDAVFAQRDAAAAARDAELAALEAARVALLDRLAALGAETPKADISRTLAEVDQAWRQAPELPRGAGEALERRYRTARAAATDLLTAEARRRWQGQLDTLAAKLALCEEREGGAGDLDLRWAALHRLPARWEEALAQRWASPVDAGPLPAVAVDGLLLRLEAALDLPTAPEWEGQRRDLKLRALKDAMEGREAHRNRKAEQADSLLALLRQSGLDAAQRERMRAVIAALHAAAPGTLASPNAG